MRTALHTLVMAWILVACSVETAAGDGTRTPPDILTVDLSQDRIRSGDPVTLSWEASPGSTVTLLAPGIAGLEVPPQGERTFEGLTTRTTFELTARSGARDQTVTRTVLVDALHLSGTVAVEAIPVATSAATSGTLDGSLRMQADENLVDERAMQAWLDAIVPGEYLVTFTEAAGDVPVTLQSASTPLLGTLEPVAPGVALLRSHRVSALGADLETTVRRDLATLRATPGILGATPNMIVKPTVVTNDPRSDEQWALNGTPDPRFDLAPLWTSTQGSADVVVAVIDTGIARFGDAAHPDLDCGRVLPGASFLRASASGESVTQYTEGAWEPVPSRMPGAYHGTHVAGILAACHDDGNGIRGVDPSATVLPVRVFDDRGFASLAEVLTAVRWAAGQAVDGAPLNEHPAHVINLSLGQPADPLQAQPCNDVGDPVASILADVAASGVILVAAAGNTGSSNALIPAVCPSVISVGAVGPTGAVTSYSNRGDHVDVYAPGGDASLGGDATSILSTYVTAGEPGHAHLDGTSMAAPYVAGLASLLLADNPDLDRARFRQALIAASDRATILCRVSYLVTEPCDAHILDPTRLEHAVRDAEPGGMLAWSGTTHFRTGTSRIELTVTNLGAQTVTVRDVDSDVPFLNPRWFGSYELPTGAQRNVVVDLDREALTTSGLSGVRQARITLDGDPEATWQAITFDTGTPTPVQNLRIEAGLVASAYGGREVRRVATYLSTPDEPFELDLLLDQLDVVASDQVVLRAEATLPAGVAPCSDSRLVGEIRFPLGGLATLERRGLTVPLQSVCDGAAP